MSTITKSCEVDVPVSQAYNQWTQFEEFPQFMEGVEEVRQLDDAHLHWKADIFGVHREWDAEIGSQEPDSHVAWHATDGTTNAGRVEFTPLADARTRVDLTLDFEPEGLVEKTGDMLGLVGSRAEGDLERFKEYVEAKPLADGAWRGEIHGGQVND